jgi:hypothetical protein
VCAKHWPAHSLRRAFTFFAVFIFKGAQEGFAVLLDQKVTKIQVSKKASLPHKAFALQNGQNHGLESFAPLAFALFPRFSKISYAPATRKPTIVLPTFSRSCFADREIRENTVIYTSLLFNLSS